VSESSRIRIRRIIEAFRVIYGNIKLAVLSPRICCFISIRTTDVTEQYCARLSSRLVTSYAIPLQEDLYQCSRYSLMQSHGLHYDVTKRSYNRNDSLITIGPCRTRALARYCHIYRHAPELANKRWTYRTGGELLPMTYEDLMLALVKVLIR